MPLVKASLQASLEVVFASPGPTALDNGQAWADAMRSYAAAIAPPVLPPAVNLAADALAVALSAAFAAEAAVPGMESAFLAFAGALGVGMAPAFVALPPALAIGFAALATDPMPATASAGAERIANMIHTWLTTGSSTPAGGGAATPWS